MSFLGSMMSKVFGGHHAEAAPATPAAGGDAPAASAAPASGGAWDGSAPAAGGTAGASVDVEAVLNGMADKGGQDLNWRESIVDLMKLLGLDSSLTARKELASELRYTGDTNDSASMNVWLHKQVMQKFADNGGKLPDSMKV